MDQVVLKRERKPRDAWGIDWMNQKALVSISGSMEWISYRAFRCNTGYTDEDGNELYSGDIVDVERHDSIPSYNRATIEYQKYLGAFMLKYIKPIRPDGLLARMAQFVSEDKTTLYGHIYDWPIRRVGNIYENKNLLKPASTPPATEDAPPAGSKP